MGVPIIKVYGEDYDFKVELPETDTEYAAIWYVFLKHNIAVEEFVRDIDDYDDDYRQQDPNYWALIEHKKLGICVWNEDDECWQPATKLQRAYSDFSADKEILINPPATKKAKK